MPVNQIILVIAFCGCFLETVAATFHETVLTVVVVLELPNPIIPVECMTYMTKGFTDQSHCRCNCRQPCKHSDGTAPSTAGCMMFMNRALGKRPIVQRSCAAVLIGCVTVPARLPVCSILSSGGQRSGSARAALATQYVSSGQTYFSS